MKLKIKLLSVFVLVVAMIAILAGCSYKSVITLNDLLLEFEPDGSIKQLSGDKSEELLSNIDRGFRLETYYTLGSGKAWPEDEGSDGYEMLEEELEFYKEDKAVEIQVYIYLTEYNKKPLDDLALNQMKDYFQYIRSLNMSMLLRFAYDYTQPTNSSPKQDIVLTHLEQINSLMVGTSNL